MPLGIYAAISRIKSCLVLQASV